MFKYVGKFKYLRKVFSCSEWLDSESDKGGNDGVNEAWQYATHDRNLARRGSMNSTAEPDTLPGGAEGPEVVCSDSASDLVSRRRLRTENKLHRIWFSFKFASRCSRSCRRGGTRAGRSTRREREDLRNNHPVERCVLKLKLRRDLDELAVSPNGLFCEPAAVEVAALSPSKTLTSVLSNKQHLRGEHLQNRSKQK